MHVRVAAPILLCLALAAAAACSSDPVLATANDDAGSADPTEPTPPAPPSEPLDAGPPSACPPQDPNDPYCSALKARCEQCVTSMRACEVENLKTCSQTSAVFNAAARQASATCLAPGCPAKGDETCFVTTMSAVPDTPAQQKLATDFCKTCNLDAGAACAERVYFRTHDGGTGLGPGARIKLVEDSWVAKIGATCLPALADAGSACENVLYYCANQVLATAFPKSACAADAGK